MSTIHRLSLPCIVHLQIKNHKKANKTLLTSQNTDSTIPALSVEVRHTPRVPNSISSASFQTSANLMLHPSIAIIRSVCWYLVSLFVLDFVACLVPCIEVALSTYAWLKIGPFILLIFSITLPVLMVRNKPVGLQLLYSLVFCRYLLSSKKI